MAVDLKQTYRRFLEEAICNGKLEVFDEICDPGCRFHDAFSGDADAREYRQVSTMYRKAFPDMKPTILASYVDGDTAVTRWQITATHQGAFMGLQPTGIRGTVEGITIAKFRDGKLVEDWVQWDALGLMRQLGVAPSVGAGETRAPAGDVRPH